MLPNSKIEESILATIIYYDCLDSVLTSFEIWRKLIKPIKERNKSYRLQATIYKLYDVVFYLEQSEYLKQYIAQKNGFWFLKGREELAANHIESTKESEEKLKKLCRYAWVFFATPFLRGVFVSGSVAGVRATRVSDIDVLVVARKGHIWTTRFFLTFLTHIAGVRRRGEYVADRICLNHYIAQNALLIPFESLYNAHTYIDLIPLVNKEHVFEVFFRKNRWIRTYFLGKTRKEKSEEYISAFPRFYIMEKIMKFVNEIEEIFFSGLVGDAFEWFIKRLQMYIMRRNSLREKTGGRIYIGDVQLEFHPASKEKVILERYNKKLQELSLAEFYPEKDSGLK